MECARVLTVILLLSLPTGSLRSQVVGESHPEKGATVVSRSEAAEHFVRGTWAIHKAAVGVSGFDSYVELKMLVLPSGTVLSATPVSGVAKWYTEATSLAKTWQYIPFERNGTPRLATFNATILIVPPERRPTEHTEFPQIKDWSSLKISLRRTGCFGTCPSYTLTVLGDGNVIYHGDGFVHYCGDYRGKVAQEVVRQLVGVFRRAEYFRLFERYVLTATDLPTYVTSIAFDDKTMSVTDYSGIMAGMPDAVADIENTIDRLAGPKVWAKGVNSHVECEHSFIPRTTSDVPNNLD